MQRTVTSKSSRDEMVNHLLAYKFFGEKMPIRNAIYEELPMWDRNWTKVKMWAFIKKHQLKEFETKGV